MDARPAAPAPPPLQASVTWVSPSPSLYRFPSYTARLNENPNPNPEPLFNPSDGYCSVNHGSFKPVPVPKKGICSAAFAVRENISNYWTRNYDTSSLPGVSGYGYGFSGRLQEYRSYYLENSYKISESSASPVKCTTPYSVSGHTTNFTTPSGHTTNFTTPSNILKTSHHVENGTMLCNISQPTILVPSAVSKPMPSSQQSDTVLVKNSGFQFSSKPIENAIVGKFQKAPNRIGRVWSHPHKSTHSDIHKEEKVEARNAGKEEMEAKDNQRAWLEQVEIAKQSMSMDGNAVHCSSSCRPHATSAGIPGDTVGTIGSSVLMAEDASLDVILEAFRYLSDILSSSDFDASELEDHDRELLQFVMDNRRVFTVKNKKDITSISFQDSRLKDAQSLIVGLKTDAVTKLNKGSYNMEVKWHSVASKINNDELESADHHSSSDLSICENVTQAVKKTFQSSFSNNEEGFHVQVYKKLWINAEAALCSLKYELQLAKMRIEVENRNHQTKDKLQQSPTVSSQNSMHEHAEQEVPLMPMEKNPPASLPTSKDTDVAPIIAILNLKDQDDTPNSTTKEQQLKSAKFYDLGADGKLQQLLLDEMNKMRAIHVDSEKSPPAALPTPMCTEAADVMARLKVLKDQDDTPNSTGTTEQPSLAGLRGLEVRHATLCPNGSTKIDTSTWKSAGEINQGPDASVCSTNTEVSLCERQSYSGGEASIFSSEWEFELL